MARKVVTKQEAVLQAIAEFDRLGREAFLATYGFGMAKRYYLAHEGSHYDSKAIYGVAFGYEHPNAGALTSDAFTGGEAQVARRLENLGFVVHKIPHSIPVEPQISALVLTSQEETSGGAYDHWRDVIGVQYHYPNKYKNLVKPGLPFVYYRGVRRDGGKRGSPEYFGVGRIGDVWRDEDDGAENASHQRWYSSIEDYRSFLAPVSWKSGDQTIETIPSNMFRDGVRDLPLSTLRKICSLAGVTEPIAAIPALPQVGSVTPILLRQGETILRKRESTSKAASSQHSTKQPSRRSRFSKLIGDQAELVVLRA